MIRLSGWTRRTSGSSSPAAPGEKLYEELLSDRESTLPPPHPKAAHRQSGEAPAKPGRRDRNWLSQARSPADERSNGTRERVRGYASAAAEGAARGIQEKG